jgi:hypothetical protein
MLAPPFFDAVARTTRSSGRCGRKRRQRDQTIGTRIVRPESARGAELHGRSQGRATVPTAYGPAKAVRQPRALHDPDKQVIGAVAARSLLVAEDSPLGLNQAHPVASVRR